MPLPLLNNAGPLAPDARGMTPPLMRAMAHVGFSVAIGDTTDEGQWDTNKLTVESEIREALSHITASSGSNTSTPFIPITAIDAAELLRLQFQTMLDELPSKSLEDTFTDLKTLAENCVYISAMLERYVTGNEADEGRNP